MQKFKVIDDEEHFFNIYSRVHKTTKKDFFYNYVNKELLEGFRWLDDKNPLLDYGCGIGLTLDIYLKISHNHKNTVYGVDISQEAIKRIRNKYKKNNYKFYKITNNKIPFIADSSINGCYLTHVLHHSHQHQDIFREIYKKLKPGGKFFICDLSAANCLANLGRKIFIKLPKFIKNKFSDDLVVDGAIPQKYNVNISVVVNQLEKSGFKIEKVGYGHLFAFIFVWLDKIFFISKIPSFKKVFKSITSLELFLLKFIFFQKRSHLFYIKCLKNNLKK